MSLGWCLQYLPVRRVFAPSLYAIYRQSRAVVLDDAQSPRRRQQQRERVAVAMLGFVLKQQSKFCAAFLQATCGYKSRDADECTIYLVVSGCGDLAVCSKRFVAVYEFKIDARLGG